jgi:hypothetical protein
MASKSEVFLPATVTRSAHPTLVIPLPQESRWRSLLEIASLFMLILGIVWTPIGAPNTVFAVAAILGILHFGVMGRYTRREMGLTQPLSGLGYVLASGLLACGGIVLLGLVLRFAGAGCNLPLGRSWQYMIWAIGQEFILQSIIFVRLEGMLGSSRSVIASAALFAMLHVPSPVLTVLSFLGGLLFCELFRRWRNLYAVGLIHAALGLTIAASLPDRWLHHMRVGMGYLTYDA